MTVHLIVSCVKDKKFSGSNLSDVKPGKINNVYSKWVSLLKKSQNKDNETEAINLYKGNAWKTNIDAFNSIDERDKKLWIVSCGYGLINSDTKVTGYQATFQQNEEGSISSVIEKDLKDNNSFISKSWWDLLVKQPPLSTDISSLNTLLSDSPLEDKFIIVISKNYLDAVSNDLLEGLKKRGSDCLIISNSQELAKQNYRSTFPQLLSYIEGAEHDFPGNMISLNGQIALALIKENFNQYGWDIERFNFWTKSKGKRDVVKKITKPISDKQVEDFIRSMMIDNSSISKTACLKQLRSQEFSCEQKRFQKIYESILLANK
jgi:hypothetical protein